MNQAKGSVGHARRLRSGLTALELLAALTLTALLLGAVSGLLRLLAVRQKTLVEEARFVPWHRPLLERLRWDLDNARQFDLTPDRLRLVGFGGRETATHAPTHRPTEVLYRIVPAADQAWLVREEIQLDAISNNNRQTELVCSGVSSIAMEVPGEQTKLPRRSGLLPDRCRLQFMGNSPSVPLMELQYCP